MKKRWFFEPWFAYFAGPLVGFGGAVFTLFAICWLCIEIFAGHGGVRYVFLLAVMVVAFFASLWFHVTTSGPRVDWLCITGEYVEWHCFLRRKRRLYYRDCVFIDVETFNKEALRAIIRGDECAMVYFSTEPYPEDKRGLINHVYCSDSFIKFRYTDKLAEALLAVLPEGKARHIQAFYARMKLTDERMEREWQQRRARARARRRKRKNR